jgi:hypothetical protein
MSRFVEYTKGGVSFASRSTGVNFEKILTWAAIGGGIYIGLQILGFFKKAGEAGDALSRSAADAYVAATNPPVIQVLGRVVLPNGQKIALKDLKINSDFTFVTGTVKYKLTKRRPDNDYDAVRA